MNEYIQTIKIKKVVSGVGTSDDPVRSYNEYWSLTGEFLADDDQYKLKEEFRDKSKIPTK